uniref:Uncharacterized protein n=1 Tax=Salmo trutta TaxID=8032 RepID=A0A674BW58_SALTR
MLKECALSNMASVEEIKIHTPSPKHVIEDAAQFAISDPEPTLDKSNLWVKLKSVG